MAPDAMVRQEVPGGGGARGAPPVQEPGRGAFAPPAVCRPAGEGCHARRRPFAARVAGARAEAGALLAGVSDNGAEGAGIADPRGPEIGRAHV